MVLLLLYMYVSVLRYRNDLKFSDRYSWANSADQDQTAPDQGLHYLPFRLHRFDSLLYGRATYFKFYSDYNKFLGVRIFRKFKVKMSEMTNSYSYTKFHKWINKYAEGRIAPVEAKQINVKSQYQ